MTATDDIERWDCICRELDPRLSWVPTLDRPVEDAEDVCALLLLLPSLLELPSADSLLDLVPLLELEAGNSD